MPPTTFMTRKASGNRRAIFCMALELRKTRQGETLKVTAIRRDYAILLQPHYNYVRDHIGQVAANLFLPFEFSSREIEYFFRDVNH